MIVTSKPEIRELGIVLIAHGSRLASANADLYEVATRLRERGFPRVIASFLELVEPGIVAAGNQCVADGAQRVILLPYFLSAGRHVVQDLEAAREDLASRHPTVEFLLAKPLGPHILLQQILLERIEESLELAALTSYKE